ncbi:MAG TPA: elongation factor G [Bacilli bacterium]|nr:elongation factor G [Bacilli bacterium]HQA55845.1 elongation factor G [Bacilli bacterium]
MFDPKNIRNIVLLGHQSSGKTSLVESLLFVSGVIPTKGEVERKNTVSDYNPDEQKRGASIQTAVMPLVHKDHKINIIDIPGNDDFISESIGVTRFVKGAVLVIDASVGIQVGTIKHWNQLRRRGIPTFIFVNKMDKEGVNFDELLQDIRTRLGSEAIPFCYPLGHDNNFDGFVNVINLKAQKYDGKQCVEAEIYEDKKAKVFELHNTIVEEVAKTDDSLLEKFFGGESFTDEEMKNSLRKGVIAGSLVPVIVGSVLKDIGIKTMLDMFIDYLPAPSDLKPFEALDESGKEVERHTTLEEPFSAYVFKTVVDPYSGNINLIKVNSGVLHTGDDVSVNGNIQRVSMLFTMCGKKMDPISEVGAGDIAAITRLEGVASGMTLSSPKAVINYKAVKYPTAVIFKAIELKNKNDESKIGSALAKIQLEDPCVEVKRNSETKQLLIGGVSNSHIDFVLAKIKDNYKIDLTVQPMKIVYRESIKKVGQAIGRYVKQSGGSGFYGVVDMRFESAPENVFTEEVFGGAVPRNYFPAVEKGFFEAIKSGPLAGFPVIGVKAVLVDGKYHPVDSNEQAFKMAAILAFKEAYPKCSPIILEPIIRVKVNVESRYTGDVLSDLNTRRAKVQNIEEGEHGVQEIEALVPEAEIIDYATQLKSITQASGYFNRTFECYEEVPEYLKDKVIKENKIEE